MQRLIAKDTLNFRTQGSSCTGAELVGKGLDEPCSKCSLFYDLSVTIPLYNMW